MTALIFDVETHKLHGDIIEAAAMELTWYEMGKQKELFPSQFEYKKRFKPSEPISLAAMAVHHIIDEDLVKCPSFTKFEMPKNDVQYLIGHNIDYDITAINRAGTDTTGIKSICTLAMARHIWPTLEAHNLTALAYHISSDRKATRRGLRSSHSALTDCQTTLSLLLKIVREKGFQTFEEIYQFSEIARIPTHIFYGKHRGKAITTLELDDIYWLLDKSQDNYLTQALETELTSREIRPWYSYDEIDDGLPL